MRLALLALLAACAPTETGNPPIVEPDGFGVEVDFGFGVPEFRLTAPPGSVDPAEGVVRITPLDADGMPIQVPVATDGSIDARLRQEGEHRLEVLADERSAPLDFLVEASDPPGTFRRANRDLPCITVDVLQLDVDGTDALTLDNACDAPVDYEARLRLGRAGHAFTGEASGTVQPGDAQTFELSAEATHGEDHLLIEISAPETTRRVVTLY